jgi:hypothetical protein
MAKEDPFPSIGTTSCMSSDCVEIQILTIGGGASGKEGKLELESLQDEVHEHESERGGSTNNNRID